MDIMTQDNKYKSSHDSTCRLEELRRIRQAEDDLFLSYREREDLLDKEYTFAADGELIVIQSPDRSKMPGTGIQLGRTFQVLIMIISARIYFYFITK